jgi:hypothetical protein
MQKGLDKKTFFKINFNKNYVSSSYVSSSGCAINKYQISPEFDGRVFLFSNDRKKRKKIANIIETSK